MTDREYISCVDTAKLIRKTLKAAFPKQKFSVVSDQYSMGASIRVRWIDGPTVKLVEEKIGHFHGASFDGMIDLKSYHATEFEGRNVHFGADYLFCTRDSSPRAVIKAAEAAEKQLGWPIPRTMAEAATTRIEALDVWADQIVRAFLEDRTGGPRWSMTGYGDRDSNGFPLEGWTDHRRSHLTLVKEG